MPRFCRLGLAVAALCAVWATPAFAVSRPPGPGLNPGPTNPPVVTLPGVATPVVTAQVATKHFVVNYSTQSSDAYHITETRAHDIAAWAEQAYAKFVSSWGYPAPAADGDAKTDIYIADLSASLGTSGVPDVVYVDNDAALSSSAWIVLDYQLGLNLHTVARSLFDAIELGIWNPSNRFMIEAPAEWAANTIDGFSAAADSDSTGPAEISLDCFDFILYPIGHNCAHFKDSGPNTDIQANGYSRWTFFELLSEQYGTGFVKDVLTRGYNSGSIDTSPVDMLSAALSAKGSSLADFYTAWTVANMNGGFTEPKLQVVAPQIYQTVPTGTLTSLNADRDPSLPELTSGPIPVTTVPVEHLATRYLALLRGDGADTGICYAATLSLTVTLPSGVTSRPYFLWTQRNSLGKLIYSPQALSISGTTATISVPWDTCKWEDTVGYLSLPNASFSSDSTTGPTYNGQEWVVSGTLNIDKSQVASATDPPAPVKMPGTVVDTPTLEAAPLIDVFGPQVIHLNASTRALRLIVGSSGPGALQASLGSRTLGSAKLRAGSNDVRFTLPASVFASSRSTASAANVLTLTPVSASGVAGKAVTRRVKVDGGKLAGTKPKTSLKKSTARKTKHAKTSRR